ncbi:biotin-dependent carboxyltransferase family protein [Nocardioides sp.]|uniref:5-oxoprolinase subunit C family protein n=1 Tax=Nocardioides sp. TaxID=35761 RepID=UPI0027366888|nr:biotin-dependent carboxyltransferase family protein [Nocardioides sp.]MDP3890691.1 biotin-dependent carboxyltransferase family protein [Nocardioides sp.]
MSITVLRAGSLTTIQDRGRPGLAHLGVPCAGPLDRPAADLANRLVGNRSDAAVLEVTMGGLHLRAGRGHWIAVTGAPCPVEVNGVARGHARAEWAERGADVVLGPPSSGVRSYVAVAGGFDVVPVLGSRATDTLAWVGPPPVQDGDLLAVGPSRGAPQPHDTPRPPRRGPLRLHPGPGVDWFAPEAVEVIGSSAYTVGSESNRIGLRLDGPPLERRRGEMPSEGMVLGSVQVPPHGRPVIFLADHPVTGGYPVIGVVEPEDLWMCAQARPGETLRFTRWRAASR